MNKVISSWQDQIDYLDHQQQAISTFQTNPNQTGFGLEGFQRKIDVPHMLCDTKTFNMH